MKVTLFIPVLNEIDGLKVIMPQIDRAWVHEILILDGGSTDGSKEWLRENGYKVTEQKTKGVKRGFWEGFRQAKGDVIIPFSPDGNSIAADIPKLIAKINEGYDLVVASRYLGAAQSKDDDFMSGLANTIFTGLINLLFRTKFTDAIGMYKAFKRQHLYDFGLNDLPDEHSEILLPIRCARNGLKIAEIPSPEPPRLGVQGSRAHPGVLGKYKSAVGILRSILRDALFYWPDTTKREQEDDRDLKIGA